MTKATENLKTYIDYQLNKPEREAKYEKFKSQLEAGKLTDKEKEQAEKWIEKYHEYQQKIDALEFINGNS